MTGAIYPPKNSVITFREPFYRKEFSGHSATKYYIKASINGAPEIEIRITKEQQRDVMDYLIKSDLKLTNTVVRNDAQKRFVILQHARRQIFLN